MKVIMRSFKKTVASTIVPEAIYNVQLITQSVKIKALSTNTGSVFIGSLAGQEYELTKGEELSITEIFEKDGGSADVDLQEIYCRVAVNGEGVCVYYADRNKSFRS